MSAGTSPNLSVTSLFADRDAHRRRDREAAEQLQRQKEEELAAFKKRLNDFHLTDDVIEANLGRIRRAFERGETELMIASFPSSFCSDDGRAIINAGAPPINKPTKEELAAKAAKGDEPDWLATLPAGAHEVYRYWKEHLQPGGFGFSARIINYPDGMPGDVGLFFSWPKDSDESVAAT